MKYDDEKIKAVVSELRSRTSTELRIDNTSQILYSTDASIYQIYPIGVAFPRHPDELQAIVEICNRLNMPITARGSGSSLAGQSIGSGIIIDCSRFLDKILSIDPEGKTARVQPGVILNRLNQTANIHGLQFGPDPASAERASMGGSICNNASGAHSVDYGMAADHLLETNLVLSDGSLATFKQIKISEAHNIANRRDLEAAIYRASLQIRECSGNAIVENWPKTWRRASGFNINYLLPWSPNAPKNWKLRGDSSAEYPPVSKDSINLAQLIAGSEGTLAVIQDLTVRLVPVPREKVLAVLAYKDSTAACQNVTEILEMSPSAVELIPQNLVRLAFSVPAYAVQAAILKPLFRDLNAPPALLAVEFAGSNRDELVAKARSLERFGQILLAETKIAQNQIWNVRKVGLGLLMSRPSASRPWSFIEDLSVPVENLKVFIEEMQRLFDQFNVDGEMYGHASAGCLHIRPMINIKTTNGIRLMREIAAEAVNITLALGGAVSGEHGDGLARTEWNEKMFGREITDAFRLLKLSADPNNILNPGKIVAARADEPPPKMDASLRFDPELPVRTWETVLDFGKQASLASAIEQCNGAGVCRKYEGLMCPSFRATREEEHSTRGRSNLLRAYIYSTDANRESLQESVKGALDLCLACKGCKAECPSAVDVAKLKFEFFNDYYRTHTRKLRDYLFAYIDTVAKYSNPFHAIANPTLTFLAKSGLQERILEIDGRRSLPKLSGRRLSTVWKQANSGAEICPQPGNISTRVLFLTDPFTEYFYPEVGWAALSVLQRAGYLVEIVPVIGTGRIMISKGMLEPARKRALKMVETIQRLDPDGECAVVGVEPSEVASFGDEYIDLLKGREGIEDLAKRTWTVEEFLIRTNRLNVLFAGKCVEIPAIQNMRIANNPLDIIHNLRLSENKHLLLHEHCFQKSRSQNPDGLPVGAKASQKLLEIFGFSVTWIDAGCCGMAGAFGYEKEHYELSMKVGEDRLFDAIRNAESGTIFTASGYSCRAQIKDGTGEDVYHPIEIINHILNKETA